jgi:hypothetical protein
MIRRIGSAGWLLGLATMALVAALPATAAAQAFSNPNSNSNAANSGIALPNGNSIALPSSLSGEQQKLSPQQLQSIMMYRALQSRGSGRVQRGVPQFVPFGSLGFGGSTMQPSAAQQAGGADPAAAQSDHDAAKQAAREKRVEALKAAAAKKKAAREARAAARKAQQAADQANDAK